MSDAAPTESTDQGKPATSPLEDFLREFPAWWRNLPSRGVFLSLFLAWSLLFHFLGNSTFGYIDTPSLFVWLVTCYENSIDDQHGYLVPLVVLALVWWKRREFGNSIAANWAPGLLILAAGAMLHVTGFLIQQARLSITGYVFGIFGIVGWVWGRRACSTLFFPLILLFFCIPLAAFSEFITFPLRILVTKLSVGFSHSVLGADVIRDGSLIMDGRGRRMYDVAPACSGIRSLITLSLLSTIHAFMNLTSWPRRTLLLLSAVPLAVLGNTARIVIVIVVGEVFGVATGSAIETKLGFVTFAVAIAGTFGLGYLLRETKSVVTNPPDVSSGPSIVKS